LSETNNSPAAHGSGAVAFDVGWPTGLRRRVNSLRIACPVRTEANVSVIAPSTQMVVFALVSVIGFLTYAFKGIGRFATDFLPWHLSANQYAP
jgi:hypothetical protein